MHSIPVLRNTTGVAEVNAWAAKGDGIMSEEPTFEHTQLFDHELSPEETVQLRNQLCFPLYAAAKEVVRRYGPILDDLQLTYTQYITMMVLWEKKTVSVSELGNELYLDSGTLTPLLKKMEAKNLVKRTRSAKDERRVDVSITPDGMALRERAFCVPVKMGSCMHLSDAEMAQLAYLLDKLIRNVRKSQTDSSCSGVSA
jgi:hypothetical protein